MRKLLVTILAASTLGLSAESWAAAELKSDQQRFSYMLGLQFGQQLRQEGIKLDDKAFLQAVDDVLNDVPTRLSQEDIQATLKRMQTAKSEEMAKLAKNNKSEGKKFLSENKKKSGVKTLDSGLQYKVISSGKGRSPSAEDVVEVHYKGTLIDGTEFDSSIKRGQPAVFPVNGVIQGWQEALQKMKVGDKWHLYIPSELAYGERGAGGLIGPNATLVFEVELLKIKDK